MKGMFKAGGEPPINDEWGVKTRGEGRKKKKKVRVSRAFLKKNPLPPAGRGSNPPTAPKAVKNLKKFFPNPQAHQKGFRKKKKGKRKPTTHVKYPYKKTTPRPPPRREGKKKFLGGYSDQQIAEFQEKGVI